MIIGLGVVGLIVSAGLGLALPPHAIGLIAFGSFTFGVAMFVKKVGPLAVRLMLLATFVGGLAGGAVREQIDKDARADAAAKTEAQRKAKAAEQREAEIKRLPEVISALESAVSEHRWEEAAKNLAEAARINPSTPGLADAKAKIEPELAKITAAREAMARAKTITEAITFADDVATTRAKCENHEQIAEAWNKLREVRSTDTDFARAKKATSRIERCRSIAEREFYKALPTIMIAQRKAIAPELDKVFLESRLDVAVRVHDTDSSQLTLTNVLFGNRATVHGITKSKLIGVLKKSGFKRISFDDGRGKPIYFDLNPEPETRLGKRKLAQLGIDRPLALRETPRSRDEPHVVVKASDIRIEPSSDGQVVVRALPGDVFTLYGSGPTKGPWAEISIFCGETRYIRRNALQPLSNATTFTQQPEQRRKELFYALVVAEDMARRESRGKTKQQRMLEDKYKLQVCHRMNLRSGECKAIVMEGIDRLDWPMPDP